MGKVLEGKFGKEKEETPFGMLPYEDTLFSKGCLDIQKDILDQVYDETNAFLMDHGMNPAAFKADGEYMKKYLTMNPAQLMTDENYMTALSYLGILDGILYRTYTIIRILNQEVDLLTVILKKLDDTWYALKDDSWHQVPHDIFG